jgi:carboxyl-terminal processing protease
MRRRVSRVIAPLMVIIVFVLGVWIGGHPSDLPGFMRSTFTDSHADGRLYQEAVNVIEDNYYRKVDRSDFLGKSLSAGVLSLGDKYSAYFPPHAYKAFEDQTSGTFTGVGMSVTQVPRGLRIARVFPKSPAERAGLKVGDVIIAVDGASIAGKSSTQATSQIQGEAGTAVTLRVVSGKRPARDLQLERAKVAVPVVTSEMVGSGAGAVAHVRLASFTSGAHAEVRSAIDGLLKKGAKGIVLDLRDNGGGLLNEAVLVSSIFIPEGTIVSTAGRERPRHVYEAAGGAIPTRIPVTVLVDGDSASASEIVTGALQDRKRAEVVGTHTYGKGVFQEIRPLSNGGALDLTVGEYFTPTGRNLGGGGVKQGAGIQPDVQAADDPKTKDRDEALDAAVRVLRDEGA